VEGEQRGLVSPPVDESLALALATSRRVAFRSQNSSCNQPPRPRNSSLSTLQTQPQVLYAIQTKLDFTAAGGMLYSAVTLLLLVMLGSWVLRIRTLDLLIAGCGALLFSCYLVYDVQVRRRLSMSLGVVRGGNG